MLWMEDAKLEEQRMKDSKVKAGVISEVTRLGSFVLLFYSCAIPFAFIPLCHWITLKDVNPFVDMITVTPSICLLTIGDPLLFVHLNPLIYQELKRILSPLTRFCCISESSVQPECDTNVGSVSKLDLNDWASWTSRKDLADVFKKWSEENFVSENVRGIVEWFQIL